MLRPLSGGRYTARFPSQMLLQGRPTDGSPTATGRSPPERWMCRVRGRNRHDPFLVGVVRRVNVVPVAQIDEEHGLSRIGRRNLLDHDARRSVRVRRVWRALAGQTDVSASCPILRLAQHRYPIRSAAEGKLRRQTELVHRPDPRIHEQILGRWNRRSSSSQPD